jgi:trehalose synthase-fused probable maltokinase
MELGPKQVSTLIDGVASIDIAGRSIGHLMDAGRSQIDELLPEFVAGRRWFGNKGTPIDSARIGDLIAIPAATGDGIAGHLATIDVRYADRTAPERYVTALTTRPVGSALPDGSDVLARVHTADGEFLLADSIADPQLADGLLHAMRGGRSVQGSGASITGQGGATFEQALEGFGQIGVEPLSLHTSNTSVRVAAADGRDYALKLVRRHEALPEPGAPTRALDVWKGAYLTDVAKYRNTPAVVGSIDHVGGDDLPRTIAVLNEFVPNDGDGWAHALDDASRTLGLVGDDAATGIADSAIDEYATAARNHGRRLGELHVALSSGGAASEFRGIREGASAAGERADRLRSDARGVVEQLRERGRGSDADRIAAVLDDRVDEMAQAVDELVPIDAIHTHGDFHLGQMLRTGDDVQLIDLEGAPALPMAERWQRTIALGDVARQRSSYDYAGTQALRDAVEARPELADTLQPVAERWTRQAQDAFLTGWLDATRDQRFRHARVELAPELRQAELANALYETKYELGSRPDWVDIPLDRIRRIVGS